MKSYIKIFVPFMTAILLGSLTFAFSQTNENGAGKSRTGNVKERACSA